MNPGDFTHTSSMVVGLNDTAAVMGSGDMPVLATPALVALMENAAMLTVRPLLAEGETTVGAHIDVKHWAPSPIGAEIKSIAMLQERNGKQLTFKIEATQGDKLIGEAVHTRYIVNRQQFLTKI